MTDLFPAPHRCDLHIHTALSHDGSGSVDEYCRRAIDIGIGTIGFSEHVDFDPGDPGYGRFQYDVAAEAVMNARDRYAPDLRVLFGVEVDYQEWFEDEIAAFLERHAFDYTIGSVHAVGGLAVMDARYLAERRGGDPYVDYYDAVRRSAESRLFDVIGHVGYALRRGLRAVGHPGGRAMDMERLALTAIVRSGACLEVNGAGVRHGVGSPYPSLRTLRLYRKMGGCRVTTGSDAHRPDDIGLGLRDAEEALMRAGLSAATVFRGRVGSSAPADTTMGSPHVAGSQPPGL